MKTRIYGGLILLATILAGVAWLAVVRTRPAPAHSEAEWNRLNAKVEQLERTTAELQLQLGEIRTAGPMFTERPVGNVRVPTLPNSAAPANPIPPGSTPFVFNGITYYITPLAQAR